MLVTASALREWTERGLETKVLNPWSNPLAGVIKRVCSAGLIEHCAVIHWCMVGHIERAVIQIVCPASSDFQLEGTTQGNIAAVLIEDPHASVADRERGRLQGAVNQVVYARRGPIVGTQVEVTIKVGSAGGLGNDAQRVSTVP